MAFRGVLDFVKKAHAGQKYPEDGMEYWRHLDEVAKILANCLYVFGEGESRDLIIAGYLHDILEDTSVTIDEIKEKYGGNVAELVEGMTNKQGDKQTKEYVESVASGKEEIRLIKLADLYSNYTRVSKLVQDHWKRYDEVVVPIMEPMYNEIIKTEFVKFKKTGDYISGFDFEYILKRF